MVDMIEYLAQLIGGRIISLAVDEDSEEAIYGLLIEMPDGTKLVAFIQDETNRDMPGFLDIGPYREPKRKKGV